jgi:hypothetical protein
MTTKQMLALIMTELESTIPSELASAGLEHFDEYLAKNPIRANDKELCIYLDQRSNDGEIESVSFIVQAQLYRVGDTEKASEYFDIIYDAILGISPKVVGFVYLDSVEGDQFPIQKETSTVILSYAVSYSKELDDCD